MLICYLFSTYNSWIHQITCLQSESNLIHDPTIKCIPVLVSVNGMCMSISRGGELDVCGRYTCFSVGEIGRCVGERCKRSLC